MTNPRGLFNFRFQFGSCANQKPGSGTGPGLPAYGTMLKTLAGKVHFSIMNGDWLYEDKREFTVDQWKAQIGLRDRAAAAVPAIGPLDYGCLGKLQVLPGTGSQSRGVASRDAVVLHAGRSRDSE